MAPTRPAVPELPEVETVRLGLARHLPGRVVTGVDVRHPRATRRQEGPAGAFAAGLTGHRLGAAVRRGKYLWLTLEHPDSPPGAEPSAALVAHLGMSGQLLVRTPARAVGAGADGQDGGGSGIVVLPPAAALTLPRAEAPGAPDEGDADDGGRHLRVRLMLDDGGEVRFVDQRTFGHLMVTPLVPTPDGGPGGHAPESAAGAAPLLPAPVAHIARDLLDPHLDLPALVRATRARRTEIKRALLDQSLVSGIGNIYADEALWRARLHGTRPTDALTPRRVRDVLTAAADVMTEALAGGGTSFDALYVDVDGDPGYFARDLDAYGRAGLPCRRCGRPLRREQFMNRSSFSCPNCQRRAPANRSGDRFAAGSRRASVRRTARGAGNWGTTGGGRVSRR